jgi:hypothetical protein
MKKLLLFAMIILPSMLSAQTVSGLKVETAAGTPSTVTFDVSWTAASLTTPWLDSMWVFVDYNQNGKMTRMLISGGTLTAHSANPPTLQSPHAGTVLKIADNDKGVWVVGDARTNTSFSATVQLYTDETTIAGACAYASSYPPVGQYVSASEIVFSGTPWYEITLVHEDGVTFETIASGSTFLLPCSYTVSSFTDATGAPGIIKCMPMVGSIGLSGPSEVPKSQPVSFAVTGGISVPAAVNYTWTVPGFSPASLSGTAYATTAPAIAGAYTVTLTAHSTGYCTETLTQAVEVLDCIPSSDIYNLKVSATTYCENDAVTFTMESTTLGRTYQLYKDGTAVDVLTGTGGAVPFTGAFAGAGTYTARVLTGGGSCAAPMTGVHVVSENPAPTGLSLVSTLMAVCAGQPATLTAAATGGVSYSLDGSGWQPEADFKVTPQPGVPYTLYAKTDAGCTATQTFASVVAVNSLPTGLSLAAMPTTICKDESATLTASATGGASYSINNSTWQTTPDFEVSPTSTTAYTLYVKTTAGCSATQANAATVTVAQPGAAGAAPTACGCAEGLSECSGTCTATACNFTACKGITEVEMYNNYIVNRYTWTSANATCSAKGSNWRLPSLSELQCLCTNKNYIPNGYVDTDYWSSEKIYSAAHRTLFFYTTNCSLIDYALDTSYRPFVCVR